MNIIQPASRLVRSARDASAASPRIDRRQLFKLGGGAVLGLGLLSACDSAAAASGSDAASSGDSSGDSSACTEPAPTDGDKVISGTEGVAYEEATIKVPVARVSNNFGMMEITIPPKEMLVPHTHEKDDQVIYVIAGEFVFEFGGESGERLVAPTGSYVIKPRGLSHGFWNEGAVDATYIELSTRDTFEAFVIATDSTSDMDEINRLAAEAGITFHYDQIARILLQNKLKSVKGMDEPQPSKFVPKRGFFGG